MLAGTLSKGKVLLHLKIEQMAPGKNRTISVYKLATLFVELFVIGDILVKGFPLLGYSVRYT